MHQHSTRDDVAEHHGRHGTLDEIRSDTVIQSSVNWGEFVTRIPRLLIKNKIPGARYYYMYVLAPRILFLIASRRIRVTNSPNPYLIPKTCQHNFPYSIKFIIEHRII